MNMVQIMVKIMVKIMNKISWPWVALAASRSHKDLDLMTPGNLASRCNWTRQQLEEEFENTITWGRQIEAFCFF